MTTASFSLLSRRFTGDISVVLKGVLVLISVFRSICLTKIYCSAECSIADKSVHTVCCGDLFNVDARKLKKGGKMRRENSDRSFESWQRKGKLENPGPEFSSVLTEVVSKVKKVKVGSDKKKKRGKKIGASEVD